MQCTHVQSTQKMVRTRTSHYQELLHFFLRCQFYTVCRIYESSVQFQTESFHALAFASQYLTENGLIEFLIMSQRIRFGQRVYCAIHNILW